MKTCTRISVCIVSLLLLCHGLISSHTQQPSSPAQMYEIGDIVDNFTLPSATGDSISLHDFWGSVVLIHVWHSG